MVCARGREGMVLTGGTGGGVGSAGVFSLSRELFLLRACARLSMDADNRRLLRPNVNMLARLVRFEDEGCSRSFLCKRMASARKRKMQTCWKPIPSISVESQRHSTASRSEATRGLMEAEY